ncbi:MAG TPA: AAA-like domain-containing protein, partial [Anaerolineales bacterium]|nr:AAA-like domain-containing protein [Anaerolineales bacterium]
MKLYAGGTLSPREHYYVERPEDKLLYKLCKEGEYCYILAARQLGKSSLAANVIARLQKDGIRSLYVDLQGIGREILEREKRLKTESHYGPPNPQFDLDYKDKWYLSLLNSLLNECKDIREAVNLENWWAAKSGLDHVQKMTTFFSEILLARIPQQLIVFIDEIDRFPEWALSDDFFMALRKMHNDRFNNTEFKRLSFVIIGLRLPRYLIRDKSLSPFNIGTRIDLADFQIENAVILTKDMKLGSELSAFQVLQTIFKYTNGHPYMTHEACKFLTDITCEEDEEERYYLNTTEQVDELMEYLIKKTFEDKHLGRIRDWITRLPDQINFLRLYGYILDGNKVLFDETIQQLDDLRYSGLIRTIDGVARVRNQVYEKSLDKDWVVYQLRQNGAMDPSNFSLNLEKLGIRTTESLSETSEQRKSVNNDSLNLNDLLLVPSSSAPVPPVDRETLPVDESGQEDSFADLTDDQVNERLSGLLGKAEQKQERIRNFEIEASEQIDEDLFDNIEAEVEADEPDDFGVPEKLNTFVEFFNEVRERLPWISRRGRRQIALAFIGILFSAGAIAWLVSANSAYALLIRGGAIACLLVFIGIFVAVRNSIYLSNRGQMILASIGTLASAGAIVWLVSADSASSLLIRGSVVMVGLVLISVFVAVRKRRSLVEERLGRFLEDEREPEVQRDWGRELASQWMRNQRAAHYSLKENIARELAQANLKITVTEYIFLVFISALAFALLIYIIQPSTSAVVLGAVVGLLVPRLYIKRKQEIRLRNFDNQLSDMLTLMVTGLRAGYSTMQTMEAVSRDLEVP